MHFKKRFMPAFVAILLALVLSLPATSFAAPQPQPAVGDESFQANLAQFPGLYDEQTGTTMPVFQFGSSNIMEEVYVECPLDTDFTGQRDLIRIQIRRPAESDLPGIRVPVLFENSPYRDGTLNIPNHSVTNFPFVENPSTEGYTYGDDIESVNPRASEWPWSDAAVPALNIPASRGAKPLAAATRITSISSIGPGSFGSYMVARGYAIIAGSSIGNQRSDGYTSCGDVDETVAAMAVIQWLNGKARAYKDQNCDNEIDATAWCNGKVAMSGVSYNGTLPIAVACSGIEGLKAIIPASAISSWYDYYRENGGVIAPGGYQGEDADVLAKYCNSRSTRITTNPPASNAAYYNNIPNLFGVGIRTQFELNMVQMFEDQDRNSGDYSRFWDDRNYLATVDKVTAGIIVTHGLNDWNVKTKQFDQFYRAVKEKSQAPIKLVIHRGAHTGIYTHDAFFYNAHKWLDHYLYGIENNIVEDMPELSIISSQTGQYEFFDSWPVPGSEYTRYYLNTDGDGAAGTLSLDVPATAEKTVTDSRVNATLANWETRVFGLSNLAAPSTERLAFVSDITENVRFSGTVKATLEVASDLPYGYMTAALVEVGPTRAFNNVPTAEQTVIPAHNGVPNISLITPLSATPSGSATSYRLVAMGHADVQNPNPNGKTYIEAGDTNYIPEYYYQTIVPVPGEFNSYTFSFEANDWEFRAGNKLAVMVYSIDYRYTPTPAAPHLVPELTVKLGAGSYVEIPSITDFNTLEPAVVSFIVDGKVYAAGPVARGDVAESFVPEMPFGLIFDGWRTGSDGGPLFDFNTPIEESVNLYAGWCKPIPTASVEKLKGNQNALTVTVTEYYSDGRVIPYTEVFSIDNNAIGVYNVAGYNIYVDTKGNVQIRECYIIW